jgi:hypothetical protein
MNIFVRIRENLPVSKIMEGATQYAKKKSLDLMSEKVFGCGS